MDFARLQNAIEQANKILLVTHPSPDHDAIGSTAAFIGYLKELGKEYLAYCADAVPSFLLALPWASEITSDASLVTNFQPDLIIAIDLSDAGRLGLAEYLPRLPNGSLELAVVDHHPGSDLKPDIDLRDTSASSTAELLTNYFQVCEFDMSAAIAESLMVGLLADTENFTNAATSASALMTAARLMRAGAQIGRATKHWRSKELPDLKLFGLALARLKVNAELNVATTFFKKEDLARLDIDQEAASGISNYLKQLGRGHTVLVLKEKADGHVTGSLRSLTSEIDVSKLARYLGGGGHVQASGFRLKGRLEKVDGHWRVI